MSAAERDAVFGATHPHWVVAVPAAELFDWAWLAGELAAWLDSATEATSDDLRQYFSDRPCRRGVVSALDRVATRIDALLDRSRP